MDWYKYINSNSEGDIYYSDCQLVTAINAYYYLTGNIIKQDSIKYKELAEICGCVHGSCINIKKAWKKLEIKEDIRFKKYDIEKYLKRNCFIELSVHNKYYGYHSIAIVDYIKKAKCLRITNFRGVTSIEGWIFLEDIEPFIIDNPDKSKPYWHGRTFCLN